MDTTWNGTLATNSDAPEGGPWMPFDASRAGAVNHELPALATVPGRDYNAAGPARTADAGEAMQLGLERARSRTLLLAAVVLGFGGVLGPVAALLPVPASADSPVESPKPGANVAAKPPDPAPARPLFRPANGPNQSIASSELTGRYTVDLTRFLMPSTDLDAADISWLDRLPERQAPTAVAGDSSDVRLVESKSKDPVGLPPADKRAANPQPPGSIPGPAAAAAAFLGGLVLLVKVVSEFLR
jgi:hypothetical protein